MACCSWKTLVILAVAVGLLAYAAFQTTTVTLTLSRVIKSDPQSVFQLFENPEDLTRYHPYFAAVEVKEKVEKASENVMTEYLLTIREEVPPIVFPINITAIIECKYRLGEVPPQSERFMVSMDATSSALGTVMKSDIVWTIAPTTTDGETLLSEVFQLYPPKILASLVEDAARVAHEILLNNIKETAESTSD